MAIEIERKFRVTSDVWKDAKPVYYCQGYLNQDRDRTVRVRIAENQAWLTIKGPTVDASRLEFEYEIPVADAKQIVELCNRPLIEKHRRVIKFAGNDWEVDEFLNENQGLVVAEVELDSRDQLVELPDWIGEEVTDDPRYFNSNLARNPYSSWAED